MKNKMNVVLSLFFGFFIMLTGTCAATEVADNTSTFTTVLYCLSIVLSASWIVSKEVIKMIEEEKE